VIQRAVLVTAPLLLVFVACGCSKAPAVVTVNVDRVVKESQRARRLIEEVESYADATGAKLNDAADQLRAAASDPRRSPQEIGLMQAQWNRMRQEAEEQVDAKRSNTEDEVHHVLSESIRALAEEQGWDLVIRQDRHAALWSKGALDRTDIVIQRMDTPVSASAHRALSPAP
jgi:Skp family chaperone for outer membrane proteins